MSHGDAQSSEGADTYAVCVSLCIDVDHVHGLAFGVSSVALDGGRGGHGAEVQAP
jgi:hypothetical protein